MFNLVFKLVDLSLQLRVGVVQNHCGHDVPGNTAGAAEVGLLGHIHVGHVLVFAEQRQVEHDLEGLGVGGQDDQVSDSSVEAFGGLVGSLLQLLVEGGLVAQIQQLLGQLVVGLGPGSALGLLLDLFFDFLDLLVLG